MILIQQIADLRDDINHIIEEWHPLDRPELSDLARRHMEKHFVLMKQSTDIIEEGIRRSASSVVAIRQLSGVDGYQLNRTIMHDLLEQAKQRIIESVGEPSLKRYVLLNGSEQAEVYTNTLAVSMVIELTFKNWIGAAAPETNFQIQTIASHESRPCFIMKFAYQDERSAASALEHLLPFLNQILRPYESAIVGTQQGTAVNFCLGFPKERSAVPLMEAAS
jgi:hypothetical protein